MLDNSILESVMTFQEILDQLLERVPESVAASFNDRDGEPVVSRSLQIPNEALQLLSAYQQTTRRHLMQAVSEFETGPVRSLAFRTNNFWVLMGSAQEQCTLILVMRGDGILGRARFELERTIQAFNAEL